MFPLYKLGSIKTNKLIYFAHIDPFDISFAIGVFSYILVQSLIVAHKEEIWINLISFLILTAYSLPKIK